MDRQRYDRDTDITQYSGTKFGFRIRKGDNAQERYQYDSDSWETKINLSLACECGESFNTTEALKSHILKNHNPEQQSSMGKVSKRRRFRLSDKIRLDQKQKNKQGLFQTPVRKKNKRSYQLIDGQVRCRCGQSFNTPKEYYSHKQKNPPQLNNKKTGEKNSEPSQEQNQPEIQGLNFNLLSKGSKQYYSTRIFMCGSCQIMFVYEEQLRVHLFSIHSGAIPDGTIYGVRKDQLLKYFEIPFEKSVFLYDKYNKFKDYISCGCGKKYTSNSSLTFHVMYDHRGIPPENTAKLPRRMRASILDEELQ